MISIVIGVLQVGMLCWSFVSSERLPFAAYVVVLLVFELVVLGNYYAVRRKVGSSIVAERYQLSTREFSVLKRYPIVFAHPFAAADFARALAGIGLAAYVWIPWMLYREEFLWLVVVAVNRIALLPILLAHVDPRSLLKEAASRPDRPNWLNEDADLIESLHGKLAGTPQAVVEDDDVRTFKYGERSFEWGRKKEVFFEQLKTSVREKLLDRLSDHCRQHINLSVPAWNLDNSVLLSYLGYLAGVLAREVRYYWPDKDELDLVHARLFFDITALQLRAIPGYEAYGVASRAAAQARGDFVPNIAGLLTYPAFAHAMEVGDQDYKFFLAVRSMGEAPFPTYGIRQLNLDGCSGSLEPSENLEDVSPMRFNTFEEAADYAKRRAQESGSSVKIQSVKEEWAVDDPGSSQQPADRHTPDRSQSDSAEELGVELRAKRVDLLRRARDRSLTHTQLSLIIDKAESYAFSEEEIAELREIQRFAAPKSDHPTIICPSCHMVGSNCTCERSWF